MTYWRDISMSSTFTWFFTAIGCVIVAGLLGALLCQWCKRP